MNRKRGAHRLPSCAIALLGLAGAAAAQPTPQAPPTCETPQHRQFDFWVGRWDVFRTGTDTQVARSLIENLYMGCVIRENWMPLRGGGGGSLNSWVPGERRWRQVWTDSTNAFREFSGGIEDGAMVLTASSVRPDGTPVMNRMRFTREPDGSVRQVGTVSTDGGRTWAPPGYDLTYRPATAD